MADSSFVSSFCRLLDPVLHLQKLGLELKCPLCSCIPKSTQFGFECRLCNSHYQASGSGRSIFELVATKRTHVPLIDFTGMEVGIDFDKPGSRKESKVENYRVCSKERANLDGKANLNEGFKQSELRAKEREKLEEVQSTTGSPPSFGDAKGFDFNSTDQGSEQGTSSLL